MFYIQVVKIQSVVFVESGAKDVYVYIQDTSIVVGNILRKCSLSAVQLLNLCMSESLSQRWHNTAGIECHLGGRNQTTMKTGIPQPYIFVLN